MTKYSYVIKSSRGVVKEMISYVNWYKVGDEVFVDGEPCRILAKNF